MLSCFSLLLRVIYASLWSREKGAHWLLLDPHAVQTSLALATMLRTDTHRVLALNAGRDLSGLNKLLKKIPFVELYVLLDPKFPY